MFEPDEQLKTFGVTAVENLFITEYLRDARGEQVKVYLCLLYYCQHGGAAEMGPQDLAVRLDMTAAQVEAALRYWERRRLIERLSDDPPRYRLYHIGQRFLTGHSMENGDADYISFNEAVYALFGDERKVRPSDIATAYEWVSDLGLPQEAVIMLLNYMKSTRGKNFSFKSAEAMAVDMKEAGVNTPEEAEDFLGHSRAVHDGARAVLRRFNFRRLPTEDELKLYQTWTRDWGFTLDGILSACAETVKAATPSFGYLNAVLEGIRQRGGSGDAVKTEASLKKDRETLSGAREVLNALGIRMAATTVQKAYEALLRLAPHELVVLAAKEVALRRGRFEDIAKQLTDWQKKGITDAEKAARALSAPQTAQPYARGGKTVSAQRYGQREYTEEELLGGSIEKRMKEAQQYDEP